jgi:hypothetical protein
LKRVFHVTLLCILAIALTGCFGASPESVTKDLYFSRYHSGPIEVSGKTSFQISIKIEADGYGTVQERRLANIRSLHTSSSP